MRLKLIYILLLSTTIFASSCVRFDDITIEDIQSVKMRGTTTSQTGLDITALVENKSGSRITLLEGDFALFTGDGKVLEVKLRDKVILHRKSNEEVLIPIIVRYTHPLGALGIIPLLVGDRNSVLISGEIKARGGMASKKFKIEKMKLADFTRIYGVELDRLINNSSN